MGRASGSEVASAVAPEIFHAINLECEKALAKFQMDDAVAYEARTLVEQWQDVKGALATAANKTLAGASAPIIRLALRRLQGATIFTLHI